MKNLYNTVSEGILDVSDQALDIDSAWIAVNEWAKNNNTEPRYTKDDIVEENGELVLLHNFDVLTVNLPCPIKLKLTSRVVNSDKLHIYILNTKQSIRQGITLLDSIEEYKAICERNNVVKVNHLSIIVSSNTKIHKPLYIPDLCSHIEYNKIAIWCNHVLEIDTGMLVSIKRLEIMKPKSIRILDMPGGLESIEISR